MTNPEEAEAIVSCRRLIKDWVDQGQETDLSDWKAAEKGGDSIVGYLPVSEDQMARTKLLVPVPNTSLEKCFSYIKVHLQQCKDLKDSIDSAEVKKVYACNTNQTHIVMRTFFPLGARDILVNEQTVVHNDRAWMVHATTTDV